MYHKFWWRPIAISAVVALFAGLGETWGQEVVQSFRTTDAYATPQQDDEVLLLRQRLDQYERELQSVRRELSNMKRLPVVADQRYPDLDRRVYALETSWADEKTRCSLRTDSWW